MITKKDYTIKVGFIWTVRDDPALPNDFYKFNNDDFWDGFWLDYEKSYNYNLSFGKMIYINNDRSLRLNLSAGLGFTETFFYKDFKLVNGHYDYVRSRNSTISLIINPKIEVPFINILGLTFSPILVINKRNVYFGFGVGGILGLIR